MHDPHVLKALTFFSVRRAALWAVPDRFHRLYSRVARKPFDRCLDGHSCRFFSLDPVVRFRRLERIAAGRRLIAFHDVDEWPGTNVACQRILSGRREFEPWAYCPNLVVFRKTNPDDQRVHESWGSTT